MTRILAFGGIFIASVLVAYFTFFYEPWDLPIY